MPDSYSFRLVNFVYSVLSRGNYDLFLTNNGLS